MVGELLVPPLVISTVARKASADARGVGVLRPLGHDLVGRGVVGVLSHEPIEHYGLAHAGHGTRGADLETLDTEDGAAVGSGDGEGTDIDDAALQLGVGQLNDLLDGRESVERDHVEFNQTPAVCGGVDARGLPQLPKIFKSSGQVGREIEEIQDDRVAV